MTTRLDIIAAFLAALALTAVHIADPHHMAQHHMAELNDGHASTILLLVVNGLYMILIAAIMYSLKGCVVDAGKMAWRRVSKKA